MPTGFNSIKIQVPMTQPTHNHIFYSPSSEEVYTMDKCVWIGFRPKGGLMSVRMTKVMFYVWNIFNVPTGQTSWISTDWLPRWQVFSRTTWYGKNRGIVPGKPAKKGAPLKGLLIISTVYIPYHINTIWKHLSYAKSVSSVYAVGVHCFEKTVLLHFICLTYFQSLPLPSSPI